MKKQENNKYIVKIIAPWMVDELLVFIKHTNFDLILLQEQEEFYQTGIQKLRDAGVNVLVEPFSKKSILKKLVVIISFIFSNLFKFKPDYNFVIAVKAIYWFLKLDLSMFSKESNIHAQFATQSSIISLLIKKYYKGYPKFTFTFHAYDIYFKNKWFNKIVENSEKAFSISEYNVNYVYNTYKPSSKVILSRLGVFINKDNAILRKADVKSENTLVLGLMSWFVDKKGINFLLDSFVVLKKQGITNIKLILAGDGPLKGEIVNFIDKENLEEMVSYVGSLDGDDKIDFYKKIDTFILPSITLPNDKDGIPVVLMEAIAHGLPIVSTNVSGIPEICINNENGFLIEQKSVSEITEAILKLYNNPNLIEQFSKNALIKSKEYDIESNSKTKLELMNWI